MAWIRIGVALVAAAIGAVPLAAAPAEQITLSGKVGKSNVQVRLILHPQVDKCSAAQLKELRKEGLQLGVARVRGNLKALVSKSGTDASGAKEFFGVDYLAGCPKDGTAWLAFPVEGKDKLVTRYAPEVGWSAMMKL